MAASRCRAACRQPPETTDPWQRRHPLLANPVAERLQKFLAQAGYGSRREIENWIREGRISINEKPAELGVSVTAADRIRIDGRLIPATSAVSRPPRTMIYHKPAGELTTRKDAAGRPTVFDNLPKIRNGRWISVGRLDFNTAGLLLVTTDGELAHRLMHPSWQIEREYAVRILGEVDEAVLQRLREGVMLEDGLAAFVSIQDAGGQGINHWYHVTVREGRNREVRRLWESQGLQVSRLIRIRFGPVDLPRNLRAGRFQDLVPQELAALYAAVKLPVPEVSVRRKDVRRGRHPRKH
jgi:23S rRNA pseudouridine2605 synthase